MKSIRYRGQLYRLSSSSKINKVIKEVQFGLRMQSHLEKELPSQIDKLRIPN